MRWEGHGGTGAQSNPQTRAGLLLPLERQRRVEETVRTERDAEGGNKRKVKREPEGRREETERRGRCAKGEAQLQQRGR